jgi:prevent-host-death family protein
MHTVKQNTTIVGLSEVRTQWKKILELMKHGRVEIARRNKPEAVLLSLEEYEKMENMLDVIEDIVLGREAQERMRNSKPEDYVSLEEVMKRFG